MRIVSNIVNYLNKLNWVFNLCSLYDTTNVYVAFVPFTHYARPFVMVSALVDMMAYTN